MRKRLLALAAALAVSLMLHAQPARAVEDSETELAKKTQNPVADLISVPFQSTFNFNTGTKDRADWQRRFQIHFVFPK